MSETLNQIRFRIDGMDCASCAAKIDTAVRRVRGIEDVSVSVTAGTMTVSHDGTGDLDKIASKVRSLGYSVEPMAPEKTVKEKALAKHEHSHDHSHHDHDHDHDHEHEHEHGAELSEIQLRVRALENILTEKGYVDPAALDSIIETYETKVGPHIGAQVVARACPILSFARRCSRTPARPSRNSACSRRSAITSSPWRTRPPRTT